MTMEQKLEQVYSRLDGKGYRMIAGYSDGGQYFKRYIDDVGVQIIVSYRMSGGEVQHYEVFREVSQSNITADYLSAI